MPETTIRLLGLLAVLCLPISESYVCADQLEHSTASQVGVESPEWFWNAGGEATLLRPVFDDSVGLIEMRSDGATREDFLSHDLRFDMNAGYCIWLGLQTGKGTGIRGSFWSFDSGNATVSGRPDANGFGRLSPVEFGDIDISSTIPNDRLTVTSGVLARTALGEVHHLFRFDTWSAEISAGVEYGQLRTEYLAELVNDQVGDVGRIDYRRRFGGVGPTLAGCVESKLNTKLALYANGRTSMLFGRNSSQLTAGEDLDLNPSFTTVFPRESDDFVLRVEGGTGVRVLLVQNQAWASHGWIGLQAQQWVGAGSLHSEDGSLGFWGMNLGLSMLY